MKHRFTIRTMLGLAVVPLAAALCCGAASADELADVNALLQSKQDTEALKRADAYLKQSPRDARMRFAKGLILADMGRRGDAIEVFEALTSEFPAMPEPYNNIAVLHAAEGRYEDARIALEKAIKANPTYTKAYENLGDIYATLATQRYGKLLQQDPDNAQVRLKYLMVRSVLDNASENLPKAPAKPVIASAEVPAVPAAPAVAAPVAAPSGRNAKATTAANTSNVANAASKTKAADASESASASNAVKPASPAAANGDRDEVLAQLNAWAKAWSDKDVDRYLSFYGSAFKPPKGESRRSWESQRRSRISKPEPIQVSIDSPAVTMKDGAAKVYFVQRYVSGKLSSKDRKVLVMQKADGQWKIVEERVAG